MNPEETLRKGIDAFNRHDPSAFAQMYASDATITDPQYPEPLKGRDAARDDMEGFFRAFPDIRAEIHRLFVDGDAWALEVTMSGTHQGPLQGPTGEIPATGKKASVPGVMTGRVNANGEVVEERRYYDAAGLLAQLGLLG